MCDVKTVSSYFKALYKLRENKSLGSLTFWVMTSVELHTVRQQLRSKHNRFILLWAHQITLPKYLIMTTDML